MVVGRGGAAGGVAPGSQRFPQEGSLQLSRVGASARQGRRSFLFTPIPKGGLLIGVGGGGARTRDENSLRGAGAGWKFLSSVSHTEKVTEGAPKSLKFH